MFGYLIKVLKATGVPLISDNFIHVEKYLIEIVCCKCLCWITYSFQVADAN